MPGHWEGDLIIGAGGKSAIGTLVERSTGFLLLLHLPQDHTAVTVAEAMTEAIPQLPEILRRSLHSGRRFKGHGIPLLSTRLFILSTRMAVPRSPMPAWVVLPG